MKHLRIWLILVLGLSSSRLGESAPEKSVGDLLTQYLTASRLPEKNKIGYRIARIGSEAIKPTLDALRGAGAAQQGELVALLGLFKGDLRPHAVEVVEIMEQCQRELLLGLVVAMQVAGCVEELALKVLEIVDRRGDTRARVAACHLVSLSRRPRPEAQARLEALFARAKDASVRSAALLAMYDLDLEGDVPVGRIRDSLKVGDDALKVELARDTANRLVRPSHIVPVLLELLRAESTMVRIAGCDALARYGWWAWPDLERVRELLKDEDTDVQDAAKRAMSAIAD